VSQFDLPSRPFRHEQEPLTALAFFKFRHFSKPVFRLIFTGGLALDSGSGICIDRQHLELGQVRHVDRKAV
jgi:hypothetical protein